MIPRGYTNNTHQQMQHEQIPGHPLTPDVPLATPITVNLRRVSLVGDQAGIGPGEEMTRVSYSHTLTPQPITTPQLKLMLHKQLITHHNHLLLTHITM